MRKQLFGLLQKSEQTYSDLVQKCKDEGRKLESTTTLAYACHRACSYILRLNAGQDPGVFTKLDSFINDHNEAQNTTGALDYLVNVLSAGLSTYSFGKYSAGIEQMSESLEKALSDLEEGTTLSLKGYGDIICISFNLEESAATMCTNRIRDFSFELFTIEAPSSDGARRNSLWTESLAGDANKLEERGL